MARRAVIVSVSVALLIGGIGAVPAAGDVVVDLPGGGWVTDDRPQSIDSTIALVSGPGQPPAGAGSVRLTSADNQLAILINVLDSTLDPPFLDFRPFAGLSGQWSTYTEPGGEAPVLKFEAYREGVFPGSFMTVNFEPRVMGTVTPGTWQTWTVDQGATVWQTNAGLGACVLASPCTLAAFNAAFPDAAFYSVQLAVGSTGGPAITGYADAVTLTFAGGSIVTDFEAPTAPIAVDDHYATPADDPLVVGPASGVLLNDVSQLGDPMEASLATATTNGTIELATDGSFTYTPAAGFTGTDSVTYVARDLSSSLESTPATVTIVVTPLPAPGPEPPPTPPSGVSGSQFTPLDPQRIVDTRSGLGASGPLAAGSTTPFVAAGAGGVPANGVSAVVLNVTATEPEAPGYVQVFPADTGTPGTTSNVNVDHPDQTISNLVVVGVDPAGSFAVHTLAATQLVVDVYGYFTPVAAAAAGRLVTVDPVRVLDTRTGLGTAGATSPLTPGGTLTLPMGASVPTGATAVVMTLTATESPAPGFVQAIPAGGATALGASSNLNLDAPGDTMANLAIVPLGAGNAVTLYSQPGGHLVADVVGYFTGSDATSTTAGLLIPVAPVRLADSRVTNLVPSAGTTIDVPVAGRSPLPDVAPGAIVGTVTATDTTAPGFVQVIPTGATTPVGATSSLNINGPDQTVAAATILDTTNDSVTVHTQTAASLIYDVTGYFL